MAAITVTPGDVRPLFGSVVRRANAAEALTVGDLVYVFGASGDIPTVKKTVGTTVAASNLWGVVVAGQPSKNGSATIASGDEGIDVVVSGPVAGFSGATAGACAWVSDTAGVLADAVGTKSCIAGTMISANVLDVRPIQATRAA